MQKPVIESADIPPAVDRAFARMKLTPRESAVIYLSWTGLTNKEIAKRLKIKVQAVENHRFQGRRKIPTINSEELSLFILNARRIPGQAAPRTSRLDFYKCFGITNRFSSLSGFQKSYLRAVHRLAWPGVVITHEHLERELWTNLRKIKGVENQLARRFKFVTAEGLIGIAGMFVLTEQVKTLTKELNALKEQYRGEAEEGKESHHVGNGREEHAGGNGRVGADAVEQNGYEGAEKPGDYEINDHGRADDHAEHWVLKP